jgi:hypothetical protein
VRNISKLAFGVGRSFISITRRIFSFRFGAEMMELVIGE